MSDRPTDPWGNPLPDDAPPPAPADGGSAQRPTDGPWWPGSSDQGQAPLTPDAVSPGWGAPGQGPGQPPGAPPAWGQPGTPGQPIWGPEGQFIQPPRKNEPMAVAALVVGIIGGICGLIGCAGVVIGPVGIGLGVSARRKIRNSGGFLSGEGMAMAGLVLGAIGTVIGAVWLIIVLANPDLIEDLTNITTTTSP